MIMKKRRVYWSNKEKLLNPEDLAFKRGENLMRYLERSVNFRTPNIIGPSPGYNLFLSLMKGEGSVSLSGTGGQTQRHRMYQIYMCSDKLKTRFGKESEIF